MTALTVSPFSSPMSSLMSLLTLESSQESSVEPAPRRRRCYRWRDRLQLTRHLQGLLWTQAVLALRPLRTVQFPPQRRLTQGFLPSLALNASCRRFRRTVMHWMRVGRIGILGALEMSTPPFHHARPIPLKHECSSPVPRATRTPQTCGRCASFNGPSLSRRRAESDEWREQDESGVCVY